MSIGDTRMGNYITDKVKHTKTHTDAEQKALLIATGKSRDTIRDHLIFSFAFGTGLRQFEIVALNIKDVFNETDTKQYVRLHTFKRSDKETKYQEIILPRDLRDKLMLFYKWKGEHGESLKAMAPLFLSQRGTRLSTRRLRSMYAEWEQVAGLTRHLSFHAMRHTACTAIYEQKNDLRLTQMFARHKSIDTTTRYTHPSDEAMLRAVSTLRC